MIINALPHFCSRTAQDIITNVILGSLLSSFGVLYTTYILIAIRVFWGLQCKDSLGSSLHWRYVTELAVRSAPRTSGLATSLGVPLKLQSRQVATHPHR